MKNREDSKSPSRKTLIKRLIKYEENLKELHRLDSRRSGTHRPDGAGSQHRSRSPQHVTVDSKYIDESYVDEDHRRLKLGRLKELMASEVSRAESDGALNFKKEDIDKAYAGYPQFMQNHEHKKDLQDKSRHSSKSREHKAKRPLIDELKDAFDDAEHMYSDSELESGRAEQLNEMHHKKTLDGSCFSEQKLYHLEIEKHPDYVGSPLRDRYEFHQRKSKEIRRLQYNATFVAKKFVPELKEKKPVSNLPRADAKRAPPRIAPYHMHMTSYQIVEYRRDSHTNMHNDLERLHQVNESRLKLAKSQTLAPRNDPDDIPEFEVVPKEIDPSFMAEMKPSSADNPDEDVEKNDYVSVRESEPSEYQDLNPNQVDNIDVERADSDLTDKDTSEPTEELDLDANHQDSADEPKDKNDKEKSIESEPTEELDLDANHQDSADEPKDENDKEKSIESEPTEELDLDANDQDSADEPKDDVNDHQTHNSEPSEEVYLDANDQDHTDAVIKDDIADNGNESEPSSESDLENDEQDDPDNVLRENLANDGESDEPTISDQEPEEPIHEKPFIPAGEQIHKLFESTYIARPRKIIIKTTEDPKRAQKPLIRRLPINRPQIPASPRCSTTLERAYYKKVHKRKVIPPLILKVVEPYDKNYIHKPKPAINKPSIPCSENCLLKLEKTYIKKVYTRKVIEPHFIRAIGSIHKTYKKKTIITRALNKPLILPSPPCSCKLEHAVYEKLQNRMVIEPHFIKTLKAIEHAYKVTVKPVDKHVVVPSDNCSCKIEEAYIEKIYRPSKLSPSPERYSKQEETANYKRILERRAGEVSPERYSKQEDRSYIKKVYEMRRTEPSPGRYESKIDQAKYQKVYRRPPIHPCGYITKTEDRCFIDRPHDLIVCPPVLGHQKEEIGKYVKVHKRRVVDPSPERYSKKVEFSRIARVYDRPPMTAAARSDKSIERAYSTKAHKKAPIQPFFSKYELRVEEGRYQKVHNQARITPFIDRYEQRIERAYYQKVHNQARITPFIDKNEQRLERAFYQKVHNQARLTPFIDKYEQRLERAFYQKVFRKARGVQPALIYEGKLEQSFYGKVYSRKRIIPKSMQCTVEHQYIHRTVLWEGTTDHNSDDYDSKVGDSCAPASEYSSIKTGAYSENASEVGDHEKVKDDDISEDEEAIEIIPANSEDLSENQDDEDRASMASEMSEGNAGRRFGRTNPDEKFKCWVLDHENEPEEAMMSSPEGFLIDLDNGKLAVRSGDKVNIEPLEGEKMEEINSYARKRNSEKDPNCDFVLRDSNNARRPVIVNEEKLPDRTSNCILYDPEDKPIVRAKLRLYGYDNETGESVKYYNAVLVDENLKTSHVLVKRVDDDRILLKRNRDSTTEEIVKSEQDVLVDDIPARCVTLDPFYTKKEKEEKIYIPNEPFRVYKSPLLDSEMAKAKSRDDDRVFEGSLMVEPVKEGKDHEVFILIPPEKRVDDDIRQSKIPRYARVVLDRELIEDQNNFEEFENKISQIAAEEYKDSEYTKSKPALHKPKSLEPIAEDKIELKPQDEKTKLKENRPDDNDSADDLDESGLNCYDSVKDSEELYYQIDYDDKRASKNEPNETVSSRGRNRGNEPDRLSNAMNSSHKNTLSSVPSESQLTSQRQSNRTSQPNLLSQKSKKSIHVNPTQLDGPAKMRFETKDENDRKVKFVGIGKLSTADGERSPKKYSNQLKEFKNKAASTIQLYWLYSITKPESRHNFNLKFKRAKSKLGNEKLFRKFLLHYVMLPKKVSVEKALDNYLKVLSKSYK